MKNFIRCITIIIVSFYLSACANLSTGNLFSHYSAQNAVLYQLVQNGQYKKAELHLSDSVAGDILDNFEKGRVTFLNESYDESKSHFELSDKAIRKQQDKALLSLSSATTSVSSLMINDNLTEYYPADYELGFLHLYLSLNYLKQNNLEGALVEVRRANKVQEQAKKIREAELNKIERDSQSKNISSNLDSIIARYPEANKTLQTIQNGYLLYLSALLYETSNDLNSAYVDYKRALAMLPKNQSVIDGTLRVAKRLGMNDDRVILEKEYGSASNLISGKGRVIIVEEQGIVEGLRGWQLSLPVYDSRGNGALYSLSLPYYNPARGRNFSAIQLNNKSISTDLLTDVNAMASRNLSEKIPTMVVRQVFRVIAKNQVRREMAKKDDVGNVLANVWNVLTEQPDTRSWMTLPAKVNSANQIVPTGEQEITIDGIKYQFNVPEKGTTLVWISRQGGNSTIWHKQLGEL